MNGTNCPCIKDWCDSMCSQTKEQENVTHLTQEFVFRRNQIRQKGNSQEQVLGGTSLVPSMQWSLICPTNIQEPCVSVDWHIDRANYTLCNRSG